MTMAIATVLLEAISWVAAYLIIKRNIVDRKIKGMLLFNILSAIYIPVIIYWLENPVIVTNINKTEILMQMRQEGAISILLEPENLDLYSIKRLVFLLYLHICWWYC
jgi:hypothetical protein